MPNQNIYKNVATVKCERVETAKKYGSEHCMSPKTGLKQPKKTKNDPTAFKFKIFHYYPKKFANIDTVNLIMVIRHGYGQKTAGGCNQGLAKDQIWPKKASK